MAEPINTVRLQNIAQGYAQSATLMAAVELDLFTAVENGAGTFEEVASRLELNPTSAERLVVMCAATGLLEKQNGRYVNAPDVARYLVKGTSRYAGAWMLFTKDRWDEWGRLADHLRVKDLNRLGNIASFTLEQARSYHDATYSIGMGAGRLFNRQVDLSGRRKILDLGGGSGCYSIVAAQAHPHIEAVIFELPAVVVVANEFIAQSGVSDRVTAVEGDFTADPFPDDTDVAIMASNLPMYGRDIVASVIARTHDALLPGGEMHLIGETIDDDKTGPIGPAFWGMGQAIEETTGLAHSTAECVGYFEQAGFDTVSVSDFIPGSLKRITGIKAN